MKKKLNLKITFLGLAVILGTPTFTRCTNIVDGKKNNKPFVRILDNTDSQPDYDSMVEDSTFMHTANFVLQGVCSVDDYTLITAYDGNDKENSIVYILNNDREIVSTVTLYNRAHVGGIAYDDVHDIIWITDYVGTISGYDKDDILNETYAVPKFQKVFVGNNMLNFWGKQSIAYITYHNNKIYLGNYAFKELSILRSYDILDDGMIDLDSEFTQPFGNFTQGISFADINDQCFLLDSSSFGKTKSCLRITPFGEESNTVLSNDFIELDTPPRIEQINYTDDGDLDVVYEVNAELYNKDQIFVNPDYETLDFTVMLDYSCKSFK